MTSEDQIIQILANLPWAGTIAIVAWKVVGPLADALRVKIKAKVKGGSEDLETKVHQFETNHYETLKNQVSALTVDFGKLESKVDQAIKEFGDKNGALRDRVSTLEGRINGMKRVL